MSFRELLELTCREMRAWREDLRVKCEQAEKRLSKPIADDNPLPANYAERFAVLERDIKEIRGDVRSMYERRLQRKSEA